LLWNLVRNNRQAGHDAQMGISQKSGSDQDAIRKVMQAVTHQYHPARSTCLALVMPMMMTMTIVLMMMRVAQDGEFFEQKKTKQTCQQDRKQGMRISS